MSVEEKRTAMLGIFHETVSSCASVGRGGCVRTLWYLFSRVGPAARASLQKEAFTLKELEKLGTKAGVGASRALLCRASCPSPESTFNELSSSFHGTFALSCRCCVIFVDIYMSIWRDECGKWALRVLFATGQDVACV